MTCDQCKKEGKHIKGNRVCLVSKPLEAVWELKDFYGASVRVDSNKALYRLYQRYEGQRMDKARKQLGELGGVLPNMQIDSYLDWLTNSAVNICPHSIATPNTKYWLELVNMCDGEGGVNLPYGPVDTPDIFFQALNIVRAERTKATRERLDGAKKNSNSNNP